jgi:hypothetical protein
MRATESQVEEWSEVPGWRAKSDLQAFAAN